MKLPCHVPVLPVALTWSIGLLIATVAAPNDASANADTESPAPVAVAPSGKFITDTNITGAARLERENHDDVVVRLTDATGRAAVEFGYPAHRLDLSAFRDLAVKVNNKTAAELDIVVTGVSDPNSFSRMTQTRFLVRSTEQADLRMLMARPSLPKDHPLVKRLGNLHGFPWGHQRHWQHMDNASIQRVTVRMEWIDALPGQTVTVSRPFGLGSFSVDPAVLETMKLPLVDAFGQARDIDWPGKVASEDELRADAAADRALIASITAPQEGRSRFGGEKGAPRQKATGFFRTQKIDGKWWLIDPDGHLFWSLGVNTAGTSPSTTVKGREDLFAKAYPGQDEVSHHQENIKIKHGEADWSNVNADLSLARMMDWGLNTIGAWSKHELAAKQRLPYTLIVHPNTQGFGSIKKITDPYSGDFKKSLNDRLATLAAEHARSPWLLGVFIDNELEWKTNIELAVEILKSSADRPARRALVDFLKARHGDIAKLNKAWGADHASWDALRPRDESHVGDPPAAYLQDMRDCVTEFARVYFTACAEAMDRHFPNHLYLGCRFHVINPLVSAEASRHCDVLSMNLYRYTVAGFSIATAEDKPYIIGEFHFGIRDYGNWGVGLTWAADARNQADLVQAYLSGAIRHPNIVGAHWFQWANQCPTGRFDGENFGVGLVTVTDRPVTTLVDTFRTVADALYDYRLDPAPGRIGAPVAR